MDSFTQELIQDSLTATSEEMFAAMARAAMSSVIYEVLDFGVAITDAEGELASVGAGIPGFVGMLAPAVHAVLTRHPRPSIVPGDIFIANDPYEGGVSHANDVVLAMPVFHMAIVGCVAGVMAAAILSAGVRPFGESLRRAEHWKT